MLKKHMAACLVVTAFAAAPAFAQSPSAPTDRPTASGSGSTTSGSPAMQPGASGMGAVGSSSSTNSSTSQSGSTAMNQGSQGGMQGQFMTQMQSNQIMASDLIGTRVVSANNESIGDINDVILDRNGQVMAAVVGVGGFLGIGEKDVAVPFNSLEFANAQQAQAMDRGNNGSGNVSTTGSTTTTESTSGTAGSPAGKAANNAGVTGNSASANQPDRVVLRMTKAELQAAPAFNTGGNTAGGPNSGAGGQSGNTAPKQ